MTTNNSDTLPTEDGGPTEVSTLIELRQMFPEERRISIEIADFVLRPNTATICIGFSAATSMEFKATTLAEAMQSVREWHTRRQCV
jgi:hypothetical protein